MGVTTNLPQVGSNLDSYSFSVDVPTMNPAELTGSTGSISFVCQPLANPQLLRNRSLILTDDSFGTIRGRVSEIEWTPGMKSTVSFSAETLLQRLNSQADIPPSYNLSMNAAMQAVLSYAGFTCSGLPTSGVTVFPGFHGTMWDYLKHFCSAHMYEFYLDSDAPNEIKFRAIRSQSFGGPFGNISCTLNDQNVSQNVDVEKYTFSYPVGLENIEFAPFAAESPQILTVEAGKTVEYDIQIDGWVAQINQPVAMDLVGPETRTDIGAYCVAGSDGLPVTAAQWVGQGGSVSVYVKNDPSIITVRVVAPDAQSMKGVSGEDVFSPYSIAATAVDENTLYNSLHITGKGVIYTKETLRLPTGAVSEVTVEESGATVSNPFLSSTALVYEAGLRAAQAYAGPNYTVNGTTATDVDYNDLLGSVIDIDQGAKFRVENVTVSPQGESFSGRMDTTMADFNTQWAGKTFADFNALWAAYTFAEFNGQWAGQTFAQFNTFWAGKTFEEFNVSTGYKTFRDFAASPLLLNP